MVTMKEIAKAANVSQPTVSLILNKKSSSVRISEKTRKKVVATAKKLGYRRNELASSMKTGKNNVIGFISCLPTSYTMEMIAGASNELDKNGYLLKVFLPQNAGAEYPITDSAIKCVEQRLAGVICHSWFEKVHKELQQYGIPLVAIDSEYPFDYCVNVMTDEEDGAKKATEYLIKLGHRRIGHLTSNFSAHFVSMRLNGYQKALKNANIPCIREMVQKLNSGFGLEEEDITSISDYLQKVQPTAIFCSTDPLAMKLLQVCYKLNIKIPDDLSIIGFGGLDYSLISSPSLTTIDQPFFKIGEVAAQKIMSLSENGSLQESEMKTYLPTELLIRESTAKCASA